VAGKVVDFAQQRRRQPGMVDVHPQPSLVRVLVRLPLEVATK
jgi:hypothetical protein